jgi:TIR domain
VQVFLSYRRDDAGGYAGRLADALLQRLSPRNVFQDVTAISPGQDYTVAIDRALADSDAALVVIVPARFTAATPQGTRRLLEGDDYVHLELARALRRDIRIIQSWSAPPGFRRPPSSPMTSESWPSARRWSA